MTKANTIVKNPTGLHARPASDFVNCAKNFTSKIIVKKIGEETEVNAKSIIMLLSLAVKQGEEVSIIANGKDEEEAIETLLSLVDSGFSEI